jgi:hypothetical protein
MTAGQMTWHPCPLRHFENLVERLGAFSIGARQRQRDPKADSKTFLGLWEHQLEIFLKLFFFVADDKAK